MTSNGRVDRPRHRGGIDLSLLGPNIGTRFFVRSVPTARVIWLNHRWWLGEGYDIFDPAIRDTVEQDMLRRFGVEALGAEEQPLSEMSLWADRYGSSLGSRHGGSGRCGIDGCLIAKGIGRTPLAAPASKYHSSGRLPMSEAIREAIAGELVDRELPFGAIPSIAIIDSGMDNHSGNAVLVRPNFLRPAHFERSIYFGSSGTVGSDQHLDGLRTQDAVQTALSNAEIGFLGINTIFERSAYQLGASRAHRLWQGRLLSSNLDVDGAWADFGSFRTVPSWHRYVGLPEETFGGERPYLRVAYDTISKSFYKYTRKDGYPLPSYDERRIDAIIQRGFGDAIYSALGLRRLKSPLVANRIIDVLTGYYQFQQKSRIDVSEVSSSTLPWIHDVLVRPELLNSRHYANESLILQKILKPLEEGEGSSEQRNHLMSLMLIWSAPRAKLYHETSGPRFTALASRMRSMADYGAAELDRQIVLLLSETSRHWMDSPHGFIPFGQTDFGYSTVVYGIHPEQGFVALVRGSRCKGVVRAFGQMVLECNGSIFLGTDDGVTDWVSIPCVESSKSSGINIVMNNSTLRLPPALFFYETLKRPITSTDFCKPEVLV